MNKYSVSYNVFDGVELLEDSVNYIKEFVDYVSVILQTTSYWGTEITKEELEIAKDLKNRGVIDELVIIKDSKLEKLHLQIYKRNLGRELGIKNGCTHHMSMDCDEFYTKNEFKKLVEFHNENPKYISYIPLWEYYKDTMYLAKPSDTPESAKTRLHVSGFFPISYPFIVGYNLPIKVDPTRKPQIREIKKWDVSELKMHHLCYVRANIYKKVYNACAKTGYGNKIEHFKKISEAYENYKYGQKAYTATGEYTNLIEIEPIIKLDSYYKNLEKIK